MFDLISLIKTAGYIGLFAIVFAESGLLIGFFLPGDSLLFTAGFLASQGFLNIWVLMPLLFVAAVTGDSVGYAFGQRMGPKIFTKEDSLFFHKSHILKAQEFFEKHGGKTIIIARFVPVVRTFAPILAGVGKMKYPTFLFFNVIGGLLWAVGLTFLGYILGHTVPNIDRYLLPIVAGIIILSIAPNIWQILRNKPTRDSLILGIKKLFGLKSQN
jgi:membrane-associated protein